MRTTTAELRAALLAEARHGLAIAMADHHRNENGSAVWRDIGALQATLERIVLMTEARSRWVPLQLAPTTAQLSDLLWDDAVAQMARDTRATRGGPAKAPPLSPETGLAKALT